MIAVLSVLVFVGATVCASAVIAMTVAPQWRRIVRLAAGHVEQPFSPLTTLTQAERRIAVRHWSTTPAPTLRMRAAA